MLVGGRLLFRLMGSSRLDCRLYSMGLWTYAFTRINIIFNSADRKRRCIITSNRRGVYANIKVLVQQLRLVYSPTYASRISTINLISNDDNRSWKVGDSSTP
jgi:hypothetical protein